jgi:hypothetical protein
MPALFRRAELKAQKRVVLKKKETEKKDKKH